MRAGPPNSLIRDAAAMSDDQKAPHQTTPPSYRIARVRDFLKVPSDRRSECLREFEVWLQADESMRALLNGLPAKLSNSFVWIDDGKHHFTATVIAGRERIPV